LLPLVTLRVPLVKIISYGPQYFANNAEFPTQKRNTGTEFFLLFPESSTNDMPQQTNDAISQCLPSANYSPVSQNITWNFIGEEKQGPY
jgi:hypothetical protein